MWWAYFKDAAEVQACLAEIVRAFPCFALQKLELCRDGLRVLDYYYSPTCSERVRMDALFPETVRQRERQLFPLAPCAVDYLASWQASLGDAAECSSQEALSPAHPVVS